MITIAGRQFHADRMIRIRTKSGQMLEVIPNVAAAMVNGGTADLVGASNPPVETTALDPAQERAVAPAQDKKKKGGKQ